MTDGQITSQRRVVLRSLAIWLVLIGAEILHGILRAILLVPMVGEFRSNQIGVFTGSAIILIITYFTIRWIGAKRTPELLRESLFDDRLTFVGPQYFLGRHLPHVRDQGKDAIQRLRLSQGDRVDGPGDIESFLHLLDVFRVLAWTALAGLPEGRFLFLENVKAVIPNVS